MGLLTILKVPLKWVQGEAKDLIAQIIPPALIERVGPIIHTFGANLLHDAGVEAKALTQEMVGDIWSAMETAAQNLAPQVLSGKMSVKDAVNAAVGDLKSEALSVMLPSLKLAGEATLRNWMPILLTTAMTALQAIGSGNPTSAQASS